MENSILHRRRRLHFLRDILQPLRLRPEARLGQPSRRRSERQEGSREKIHQGREEISQESESSGNRPIAGLKKLHAP